MGLDYYGILGLKKCAKRMEIQEAYKKLSLRCHPEQPNNKNIDVMIEFTLISEAYDVLSDPLRRCVYDQFGEEGLKNGIYGPNDQFFKPYIYHGNPFLTFRQFFGTDCSYGNYSNVLLDPPQIYRHGKYCGYKVKSDPIYIDLELTLQELYFSCCKKMKIYRRIFVNEQKNKTTIAEKILTIEIKKNLSKNKQIVFKEEGDQGIATIPGDIIFVVKDLPHPIFQRNGNDLITYQKISLKDALLGTIIILKTLDDRTIRIPITEIIHPNYEKIVMNEGMPKVDNPDEFGNLIIKFTIEFPEMLRKQDESLFRQAFEQLEIQF